MMCFVFNVDCQATNVEQQVTIDKGKVYTYICKAGKIEEGLIRKKNV